MANRIFLRARKDENNQIVEKIEECQNGNHTETPPEKYSKKYELILKNWIYQIKR